MTRQDLIEALERGECGEVHDFYCRDALGYSDVGKPKPYTTSTDAALSLMNEVLPGCDFWKIDDVISIVGITPRGSICLTDDDPQWKPGFKDVSKSTTANGASLAAALLAAILKAEETKDAG